MDDMVQGIDRMDCRLGGIVVRGTLDNREKGHISGKIWLLGREEPLELDLEGNCLRDIAGCLVTFENPYAAQGEIPDLATIQSGMSGVMTASQRIRYAGEMPGKAPGAAPQTEWTGNALFLEWFSDVNSRIVLEGPGFHVVVEACVWHMTAEEELDQFDANDEVHAAWEDSCPDSEDHDDETSWAMDEFDWELNLRESDALTDRFSKVLDRYLDHPDCERIIAREMGWNRLMDDQGVRGGAPAESLVPAASVDDDMDEDFLEPNPLTEGRDWVRGSNGRVMHPLTHRAYLLAMEMWEHCRARNLLGDKGGPALQDLILQTQTLSAKLAGALDSLAYDMDVESGFVVACLKRTLTYINQALADTDVLSQESFLPPPVLNGYRRRLLEIRQDIIGLMTHYRRHVS